MNQVQRLTSFRSFTLAVILVSCCAALSASDINGQVVDNAGADVASAIAILTDTHNKELQRVTADTQGKFVLENVAPGKYWLKILPPAEYSCAKPHRKKIEVKQDHLTIQIGLDFAVCMAERSIGANRAK